MKPNKAQGIGRAVCVAYAFKTVECFFFVVQRYVNGVVGLLLPVFLGMRNKEKAMSKEKKERIFHPAKISPRFQPLFMLAVFPFFPSRKRKRQSHGRGESGMQALAVEKPSMICSCRGEKIFKPMSFPPAGREEGCGMPQDARPDPLP